VKTSTSKLSGLQPEQLEAWAKEAINRSKSGQIAAYIPLLARADRQGFAVQIRAIDGQFLSWGSIAQTFSLMSAVKPFVLLYLLCELGEKRVFDCVGLRAFGAAFQFLNSTRNRPREAEKPDD
jgi:glutaminase